MPLFCQYASYVYTMERSLIVRSHRTLQKSKKHVEHKLHNIAHNFWYGIVTMNFNDIHDCLMRFIFFFFFFCLPTDHILVSYLSKKHEINLSWPHEQAHWVSSAGLITWLIYQNIGDHLLYVAHSYSRTLTHHCI